MDRTELNRQIIDLITAYDGDFSAVQSALIAAVARNQDLLLALVTPHLPGITGYAIQSVSTHLAKGEISKTGRMKRKTTPQPIPVDTQNTVGFEMLKSMAIGKPSRFGLEKPEAIATAKAASDQHIAAIHKIARRVPKEKK